MRRLDPERSERCRVCGGTGDLAHLLWQCPHASRVGDQEGLQWEQVQHLPKCLTHAGVCPAIVGEAVDALWGE
eukprot:13827589-Alexandrium_andersonii.AAC.1